MKVNEQPHNGLLKRAREALGLTQEQVAEQTGISPRTLRRVETGGPASPHTIWELARFFGKSSKDLGLIELPDDPPQQHSPHPAPGELPPSFLTSHVTLITAALDPNDSGYVQENAQGKTVIRYPSPQKTGKYCFPTIDCKFQNGGMATAVMWRYGMEVITADIDPTPVFDFKVAFQKRELQLILTNQGWGTAYDCEIQVHAPSPKLLVGNVGQCFAVTLHSGEPLTVLTLSKDHINPTQFAANSRDIIDYFSEPFIKHFIGRDGTEHLPVPPPWEILRGTLQDVANTILFLVGEPTSPERIEAVCESLAARIFSLPSSKELPGITGTRVMKIDLVPEVWRLDIAYRWKDKAGCSHEGKLQVPLNSAECFLTQKGFAGYSYAGGGGVWAISEAMAAMRSDLSYIALIDPSRGSHERFYPIARQIPPGDVERFHIMIGASMSCHLLVRLKFFIDQKTVLLSETFELQIWNPRNAQWHTRYKDGEELERDYLRGWP